MPIPFDMIAAMLYLGHYTGVPIPDPPDPGWSLLTAAYYCVGLALVSAILNLATRKTLRNTPAMNDRRRKAAAIDIVVRTLLIAAYILLLEESALPWSVAKALGWPATGESFRIQMLGLIPYVVLFFAVWLPMYGVHRETNYGVWTRMSFIVHKARYNLYMLLAWLPFALLADWLSEFIVLLPLMLLLAAWSFPYVLAKTWGCKPLSDGEVLDMVHRLEAASGAKFSRIYEWNPGGGIQNAAAVGILPPFRYLFLTPALIRNMRGDELEAVILHELGHVRKKHLLFYLFTSLAGINLALFAGSALPLASSTERFIVSAALVLGYFRLVFGWLSRNMERQADLFALEISGSARGLANALEKLGIGAGNIRLAASWHHLGIAERVDYLRLVERNSAIARRHNSGVRRLMIAGYLCSAVVIGFMTYAIVGEFAPPALAAPTPEAPGRDHRDESHWRRVMEIMPDASSPRLELAYRLAGNPDTRSEAADLATQALRLAGNGEEADAARKLLRELGGTRNE